MQTRGAHGVNINFEGIPSSQATNFCNFMVDLANQMHAAIPGSEVSTVLYAVDWNGIFDFSIMEPAVDHYIVMGYGYYYTGSSNAGPTDPLYHFGSSYNYSLSRTITYYLDAGCPSDKLVMGLPNYGYEWETATSNIVSSTTSSGTARTYSYVKNNSSGNYSTANHQWVSDTQSDAFVFNDGVNNQCFISLDSAWRKRLDHINKTGIAGIGIWALGYDNGYTELWDGMEAYLTDCYSDPCSGMIHDFGGPEKNYYNNEDYTWTISPLNATSIDVDFSFFDVEANYDYLYIYDGANDQAPQIAGSPFTGTNSPGQFTTSTGAVTFRFYSDGATVNPGFLATYQCNTVPEPVAQFSVSDVVICQGDSVQLINNSQDADSYFWTISGGGLSSATAESPFLFPLSSGNYSITLDVGNTTGTDQLIQLFQITVQNPPIAIGNVTNSLIGIPGGSATFWNSSLNATSYTWEFGDGSFSNDQNPWHEYANGGDYTVLLIASNEGCGSDTAFIELTISEAGLIDMGGQNILISPNPNDGSFKLLNTSPNEKITVLDQFGRLVWEQNSGDKLTLIALPNLTSGIYYLRYSNLIYKFEIQ